LSFQLVCNLSEGLRTSRNVSQFLPLCKEAPTTLSFLEYIRIKIKAPEEDFLFRKISAFRPVFAILVKEEYKDWYVTGK